ncbi:MAG: hypothetical protein VX656_16960, partial [Candidatus Latescibacterota bacterium]|nr:hypothetical protein [Candidatus Latescibacterota bacterium]
MGTFDVLEGLVQDRLERLEPLAETASVAFCVRLRSGRVLHAKRVLLSCGAFTNTLLPRALHPQ